MIFFWVSTLSFPIGYAWRSGNLKCPRIIPFIGHDISLKQEEQLPR